MAKFSKTAPAAATAPACSIPARSVPATSVPATSVKDRLTDSHGRTIHDLRVSITDRCNYKCVYCRTGEVGPQYPELGIDEYLRLIRLFVDLGITKVRLTGGEPLLRHGLLDLVRELRRLRTLWDEPLDLALTTNGHLLDSLAAPLKAAGLDRVTVSMDAVDAATFERITRVPGSFQTVLSGVRAARAAGLTPLKINCVLLRGFNDDEIEGFARFAREENVVVRFIEFMPLEEGRLWSPEIVVPLKEIVDRISRTDMPPLVEVPLRDPSETACRYTFADGVGEIGIIAPVSRAFCGACSRVRLTSDGKIRTCLFPRLNTTFTADCAPALPTRSCTPTSSASSKARKPAITSVNRDS